MKKGFMQKFQETLEKYVIPFATKISQQRHLAAIRDGLTVLVPITIIGGFAVLLAQPPVNANLKATNFFFSFLVMWRNWASANASLLLTPYYLTIGIISVYVVLGVSYRLCKSYKMDTISNLISSLLVFLCISGVPQAFITGKSAINAIPLTNLGAGGMFTAIIIAIASVEITHTFIKYNIVIKLPDSVPANVAAPFNVLIPAIFNVVLFMLLNALCLKGLGVGISGLVYKLFQPLISATGSLPSILLINVLMTTFWFFGIHGGNMVGIVTTPLTTLGLTLNAEAYTAGKPLPAIFAGAVNSVYGGWISYFAVVIVILLFCKSVQSKSIAKIAAIPSIFNINEPLIFGLPTVLNPFTLICFLLLNNINFSIVYFLMSNGWLGRFFVQLPFTVPGPLQAYLASMDPKSIIVWFALLALDIVIAAPFIKAYDKTLLLEEGEKSAD
ncbi:MAG: PTS sugar transporter subunit IIC [Eggerthia catenaformis]|uniref:PTS sugar transporter subunit IIC n=1 Tax=Eggerthia catenaformis TaxID=31973 RepID=UPI003FA1620A